jgi:hypothetical protein
MLVTAEKSTIAKPFLKWAEGKTSLKSAIGENQNPFLPNTKNKRTYNF